VISYRNLIQLAKVIDEIASCDADVRSESIAILDGARREDIPSLEPLISGLGSSHSPVTFWCPTELKSLGAPGATAKV
jgi:hypothetical protein